MTDSKFLVPGAIVVAGAMIAGAIYLGGGSAGPTISRDSVSNTGTIEIDAVTSEDHIRGAGNASITVVEYSDTECPFCKVFHNTMKQVLSAYPDDLAWVYRHFPIPQLHKQAIPEAIATECAAEQGGNAVFWKYLDEIFATTNSNDSLDLAELPRIAAGLGLDVGAFNTCLSSGRYDTLIQESMQNAVEAGARGTPYTVLILKNPVTTTQVATIERALSAKNIGADAITVSSDKKKIALGGALPFDLMQDILNALLR